MNSSMNLALFESSMFVMVRAILSVSLKSSLENERSLAPRSEPFPTKINFSEGASGRSPIIWAFSSIDVMAEPTRDHNRVHVREGEPDIVEQHLAARVNGGLGPDEVVEIDLGQDDITADLRIGSIGQQHTRNRFPPPSPFWLAGPC